MAELFSFEIYTPYRKFFSGRVEAVVLSLEDGEAAVYAHHSFFTSPVVPGVIKIKDKDGVWKTAFTTEGFIEVKEFNTVLVSEAAEWPGEIDRERALNAKKRAEEALKEGGIKFEMEAAAVALKRAEGRLKAAEQK